MQHSRSGGSEGRGSKSKSVKEKQEQKRTSIRSRHSRKMLNKSGNPY
ncbi:MAG: hypothetical protein ACMUEL_07900 [Flavobacteriales bacterium Tduv]